MAISDTSFYTSIRTALTRSAALTSDQLASLKTTLTQSQYQNVAVADLVIMLNDPQTVANPTAQALLPVSHLDLVSWGQFASRMLGRLRAQQVAALTASPPTTANPLIQLLIDTINEQNDLASKTGWVDVQGSAWQGFRPLALSLGATTTAELQSVETYPDPSWTATVQQPSTASALGLGIVEASDIVQAQAS